MSKRPTKTTKTTKTTKKPSTALARRPAPRKAPSPRVTAAAPAAVAPVVEPQVGSLPALTPDTVNLGQLGLVEVKLTAEEEAILSEPPRIEDLRVKPNGAVYLSHPTLTKWLNRAFGRTGWVLLPAGMPAKSPSNEPKKHQIVCPYVLHIHGKPVASAWGEQDYWENNPEQSYGDALEGTVASALRRCTKHLGLALELWDKPYTSDYLRQHAVQVEVTQRDKATKKQWRRKADPPLPFEVKQGAGRSAPRDVPPPAQTAEDARNITREQQKRLFTIMNSRGRTAAELKDYLAARYKIASTADIQRRDYDTVVAWVEHPPTPATASDVTADTIPWGHYSVEDGDREPGSEG